MLSLAPPLNPLPFLRGGVQGGVSYLQAAVGRLAGGCALIFLCGANLLYAAPGATLKLKENFSSGKKNLCLSDLVTTEHLAARDAEKLQRYCQIALKADRLVLTAKEIELHAWAAGVIPEKVTGTQLQITKSDAMQPSDITPVAKSIAKLRRGSTVKLIVQSANMRIEREGAVLMDTFPGETVDVRITGTRKNLRARIIDSQTAELVTQ